jgi:hypothetical protein
MQQAALLAYALAVGLTLSGLAGTMIELATGRRLGFRPPFVTRARVGLSLALAFAVGPFMLANEAIAAYRTGEIDRPVLALWAAVALVWSMAAGVLFLELVHVAEAGLG